LRVQNLGVTPATPVSGSNIHIAWQDVNKGTKATANDFSDRILVVNTTTSETLVNTSLGFHGTVAVDQAIDRAFDYRLPDGTRGVGELQITTTTDNGNQVFEYLSGLDAEANNTASTTVTSVIANYADLQVQNIAVIPASPQ